MAKPFITTLKSSICVIAAAVLAAACDQATATRPAPAPTPSPAEQAAAAPEVTTAPDPSIPSDGSPPDHITAGIEQIKFADKLQYNSMQLGQFPITFGRTTLSDMVTAVGAGERRQHGGGGAFEAWVCYTLPAKAHLWMMSDAAAGGEFINAVRAIADAGATANADCPELPARFGRIVLDPPFFLGDTQAQIEARLGPAPTIDGDWRVYNGVVVATRNNLEFGETNALAVKFDNGVVSAIDIAKTMTTDSPNNVVSN